MTPTVLSGYYLSEFDQLEIKALQEEELISQGTKIVRQNKLSRLSLFNFSNDWKRKENLCQHNVFSFQNMKLWTQFPI